MIHLFVNFLKNLLFVLNMSWIFVYEYLLYRIFNDSYVFALRLTDKLAENNILYVKIFQAIALNYNLIDDKINEELLKYTDKVPWSKKEIDFTTLFQLEDEMNISFDYGIFPINSGMVSLVFKVRDIYKNKDIIIKMKRNNIELKLKEGLDKIKFTIKLLTYLPLFNSYKDNINNIVDKNIALIMNQTNFDLEIKNMIKIKNNCRNLKYIIVPEVQHYVTKKYPNIIFMDYIEGLKVDKIEKNDYDDFAKQVLKFGIVTTMIHGFSHGDLHCGNILFIKDSEDDKYPFKIGVLDFGIMYEIDDIFRNNLFSILTDIFTTPSEIIVKNILETGLIEPIEMIKKLPKQHYESISNMIKNILDDTLYSSKTANQSKIYFFIKKLNEYLKSNELLNYGIKPSDNFIKTQLALAMAHGITLTLCKNEFIPLIEKVIDELFHTNLLEK
jgi:predicted unusual protein kinase regulating ubiquinone biosynthesis (AarF/ABC1/UbiB family)